VEPSRSECGVVRGLIAAVVDHEASEFEAARLRRHLDGCPACAKAHADHQTLARAVRSAALERPRRNPLAFHRRWRRALVAVAAVLAIGLATWAVTSVA
jgi:anti-sigma factor RsiW